MAADERHESCDFLQKCNCRLNPVNLLFSVDCSRLKIREIPQLPNIIDELLFKDNEIQVIPDQAFYNLTNLLKLDLSNNEIHELRNSSFIGLTNLRSLNLQDNRLDDCMTMNIHVWEPLENLISLNIKHNLFGNFQPNLTLLASLQSLQMDFNSNDTGMISESFYSMKRLRELDLSGLTGNCSVRSLNNESFKYIHQIENLSLSACRIKHINRGTFQQLKRISFLDISNNTCLKFEVLENVTHDLQFSEIKVLKFNKIHKVFDMNTMLRTSQIKNLANTSIQEIHGDSNRLQQIEIGAMLFMPNTLDYVSARDNQFSYGLFFWDLLRTSVKTFNVSHMFTFHTEDEHPEKCSHNIVCKKEPVTETKMKYGMEYRDHTTPLPMAHQLTTLNYSSCHLHYSVSSYSLTNNILRNIDLSNNLFTSWIGPIYNVKSLKYLDLSSNFCSNVSNYFFSEDFGSLEELYLQNNILGLVLPSSIEYNLFVPKSQRLDVILQFRQSAIRMRFLVLQLFLCRFVYNVMSSDESHHRCNFLKESCICRQDQVTLLFAVDCSRLRIKEIPKLPNIIEELSFKENKIQVIPNQAFSDLTNLLKLDLSNNEIYELRNLSFRGLTNLRSLNLQDNRLDSSMGNLNIQVLKPLENLISLNIKHNLFGNFQPNLTLLVSLQSLEMDFNSNDTGKIRESFYSMKRLRELDLSGLTGNCSVRSLTNESFKYIPQIEHLSLSGCRIKHINRGTFQQLKNISTLNISNNTCLKFEVLENVTYDLQFSAIKVLKFNKIYKVFDMNTMLRTSQIKYLTNTSIEEMHGDSNRLQQIEIGALLFLPNTLDYVSARDNQFSYGPYLWDMLRISLKMFNVSHMFTFHREDEHPERCSYDIVCKKEPATESKMKYGLENSDQTF
ncbi:toll-like receptor 4 [Mytilus trossulus]|uniref:toll-like receptor 4 n=1 Tax=Mytilus trossulus TaxID=6551 RepID=UPI0030068641